MYNKLLIVVQKKGYYTNVKNSKTYHMYLLLVDYLL